jgi:glycogen phosphorylase
MRTAAALVQGVDVWVNTPRRPREASGTSGMKAAANGALNFSILDGWWDEAYEMNPNIGWAIGRGEENYAGEEEQDQIEAEELYHLLENHIIPLFYKRDRSRIPREWVSMMKTSIKVVCPYFNTNRMVRSYLEDYYIPAMERWSKIGNDGGKAAKDFAAWRAKVHANWDSVEVVALASNQEREIKIGAEIEIQAKIKLGKLSPKDVEVQLYYGQVDETGMLKSPGALPMTLGQAGGGVTAFQAVLKVESTGQLGFSVRVLPSHPLLENPAEIGLIKWYNPQ